MAKAGNSGLQTALQRRSRRPRGGRRLSPLRRCPGQPLSAVTPVRTTLRPRLGHAQGREGRAGADAQPELGPCGPCAPVGMFWRGCSAHVVNGMVPTGEWQGRPFQLFPPSTAQESALTGAAGAPACTGSLAQANGTDACDPTRRNQRAPAPGPGQLFPRPRTVPEATRALASRSQESPLSGHRKTSGDTLGLV